MKVPKLFASSIARNKSSNQLGSKVFLGAIVTIFVMVLAIALSSLVTSFVAPTSADGRAVLLQTQISAVALVFQLIGAVALGLGLIFTAQTLRLNQEGQITDRFSKAVDQLGSSQMRVRIGGIFALQRIASDSERDYWPIMEVLCAYVRESSETPRIDETLGEAVLEAPHDIQVVADVLKRRKHHLGHGETERINLALSQLSAVSFGFPAYDHGVPQPAHWEGANFDRATLDHAFFSGCVLEGANFSFACLGNAMFFSASLNGVSFDGADLVGANFHKANLESAVLLAANLKDADFEDADLSGAYLTGAILDDAYLLGANLRTAKGLTQEQLDRTFMDDRTKLPPGLHPSERTADRLHTRVGAIPERGGVAGNFEASTANS